MTMSQILIAFGIAVTVAGLFGLITCIRRANYLKGADLPDDEVNASLNGLVALNTASVGGAFLGLGVMLVGLILD